MKIAIIGSRGTLSVIEYAGLKGKPCEVVIINRDKHTT